MPRGQAMAKNTICLWYDKDAEAAARFYAKTFPDSAVGAVHHAPGDYPDGTKGDVLTVEFTVAGVPCIGLNGSPAFKHNEAFSFQIATDDQEETDRYWNAIVARLARRLRCCVPRLRIAAEQQRPIGQRKAKKCCRPGERRDMQQERGLRRVDHRA